MRPTPSTTARAAHAVAVVVGLFSTGGHTGRTHYEDVTLETMVQQSTLVVVVHPADPATVIAELHPPRRKRFVPDELRLRALFGQLEW